MSPNIQQGLFQLVYATFLHNSEAIALFVGIVISLFLLYKKPVRVYLYFLLGFTFLLARFEYLKHVVDPLHAQTVGIVVTEEGFYRTRRAFDIFFNDLVPMGLYVLGWGGLFMGVVKREEESGKVNKKKRKKIRKLVALILKRK